MRGILSGVRGRVTLTVLAVTACLYSLLGTLGFLQIANSGREAIRDRIGEVLDQLEDEVRAGTGTFSITTPDGVDARAVGASAGRPTGAIVVERRIDVEGTPLTLRGAASEARLTDSLRSLFRGLWIAVPLASVISAAFAGIATHRALRPVGSITELAREIDSGSDRRVPVPPTGDEIEQLATTVNEMLDRLAAGRLAQQRFTSDAAHELRTPLMALQGELELADRDAPIPPELLGRLTHLAARLGERVDDLVLLATLDEGRPRVNQAVDLLGVLTKEAESVSSDIEISGSESWVTGDPDLLARAVRNLLANAVRHCRTSVRATISEGPRRHAVGRRRRWTRSSSGVRKPDIPTVCQGRHRSHDSRWRLRPRPGDRGRRRRVARRLGDREPRRERWRQILAPAARGIPRTGGTQPDRREMIIE